MKFLKSKSYASVAVLASVVGLTACGGGGSSSSSNNDDTNPGGTAASVAEYLELKGNFSEDVTLDSNNVYKITGEVNFLEGTTLEIPAGTTLYGTTGSSYLAINRGASIEAEGTAAEPIIFTSAEDIGGTALPTDQGQWGGLTILGGASASKGEKTYEAGTGLYGPDGTASANPGINCPEVDTTVDNWESFCGYDNESSGTLDYIIIKYSGFEREKDQELNGLSLAGVGSDTKISNIAVIGSADDGVELWGGTVDIDGIYVYNAGDDSLDTDEGYQGTLSNVFVQQVTVDDETGSRAIEADGAGDDDAGTPISLVTLENATLNTIGRAVRLREGTGYVFDNVQINVLTSSAEFAPVAPEVELPEVDEDTGEFVTALTDEQQAWFDYRSYYREIAAIRISDDSTFDGENISITANGLGISNAAVSIDSGEDAAGEVNAAGLVDSGKGSYRDSGTLDYFRTLSNVPTEVVGVSKDMVDDGFIDSDGNPFETEVATNTTVDGVNVSDFTWVTNAVSTKPVEFLPNTISADTTLTSDTDWAIDGEVNVVAPATLTIDAGTRLYGVTGDSYLAINQGAKINAVGTEEAPIIFTSALDVAGANTGDEQGQWGGLTILGYASASKGPKTYEAGTQPYGPGAEVTYSAEDCPTVVDFATNSANCGDDDDDSGELAYVVIKYSGYEREKDQELNGLSLAGVGSGTSLSNIVVIGSADDGIEFWGGSASVDSLYIYNAGDDSIDTDEGYQGTLTDVLVIQNVVDNESGSRAIEADGRGTDRVGDPASLPKLVNASIMAKGRAARLREGTGYEFNNVNIEVLATSVTSAAAIRISDYPSFENAAITVSGQGLGIVNGSDATALFTGSAVDNKGTDDTADDITYTTEGYFDGTGAAAINDTSLVSEGTALTTVTVTEDDFSWAFDAE